MSKEHILIVDDEADIRNTLGEMLSDDGYIVALASSAEAAREALREKLPDVILLDIWMPGDDGITLLKEWNAEGGIPSVVIMMSGHGNIENAVEALRLGAYDFIEKPISYGKLDATINHGLKAASLKRENEALKKLSPQIVEPVGHSSAIQILREQAKRIALYDTWILITGEAGSGRQTFARYLHQLSGRAQKPFIDVNCNSLTGTDGLRELFGSEEGSKITYGSIERAIGGTLLLDEIADMDPELQEKLVGALDTGKFSRCDGGEPLDIDTCIIAVTQRNLEEEVQAGRFRADLFYHLNVVPLHIPPLRDHAEDIPDLLNFYLDYFSSNEKLPYRSFSTGAQNYLRNYPWPGNVRELRNIVQRILILGKKEEEISLEEVKSAVGGLNEAPIIQSTTGLNFDQPLREARDQFETAYLNYQLQKHDFNVTQMAKEAGMERTHLYRKLRSLGVEIKERR